MSLLGRWWMLQGRGECGASRAPGKSGRAVELFIILIWMMVSWVCTCVKHYQIVPFKYAQCILCHVNTMIKLFKRKKAGTAVNTNM